VRWWNVRWNWRKYIVLLIGVAVSFPIAHYIDASLMHLQGTTQTVADMGVGTGILYYIYEKWGKK
jgi:predicted RNA methylase